MCKPEDDPDAPEEAWPFQQVMAAGRNGARAEQRKLHEYLAEYNKPLADAIAAEAVRFGMLSRTVIEPTMRAFADEMAKCDWQVSVVRDDQLDRLTLFATPGIRFYCGRQLFQTACGDLIWPSSFIAFYGCGQSAKVRTFVEAFGLNENVVPPADRLELEYSEITDEIVRAVLVAFMSTLRGNDSVS